MIYTFNKLVERHGYIRAEFSRVMMTGFFGNKKEDCGLIELGERDLSVYYNYSTGVEKVEHSFGSYLLPGPESSEQLAKAYKAVVTEKIKRDIAPATSRLGSYE